MDLSLSNIASLLVLLGKVLVILAGLTVVGVVWAIVGGQLIAGLAATVYVVGFAVSGVLFMAFGKLIPVILEIEKNTRAS